ncbi:MAG: putative lipid II flippase FtsW [Nitrospirae bacterium]|nr:putative lipid II flippase FtsW [Nitrospirota bacterium]
MLLSNLKEDRIILFCTVALVGFGLVMVYSASSVMAMKQYGDSGWFLKRQAVWAAGGLAAMFMLWRVDFRKLGRFTPLLMFGTLLLLLLALVPGIGAEINGARRWIRIAGLSFQPSEFAKPAILLFLAASLARRRDRLTDFWNGVVPYLMVCGVFLLLIALEPDFGTAASIGMAVIVMLYVAGARLKHLAMVGLLASPLVVYQIFFVGFRKKRIDVFLDPWSDRLGTGFQTIQSFLAFGSGGLTGLGLGEGRQKLLFLPEPHNDFIFSVIGEELGLAGAVVTASAFALFTLCGFRLALRCEDGSGRLLAFGVTFMLGIQAVINMGVATGLFPNKGMPLPFISAGGSSLFVALVCVGLLLSVSRTFKSDSGGQGPELSAAGGRA